MRYEEEQTNLAQILRPRSPNGAGGPDGPRRRLPLPNLGKGVHRSNHSLLVRVEAADYPVQTVELDESEANAGKGCIERVEDVCLAELSPSEHAEDDVPEPWAPLRDHETVTWGI